MTRSVLHWSLAAAALVMANAGSAQDYRTYDTVRNPTKFAIDWKGFYERGNALTAAAQAEFPHVLDIPYGDDPKQKLDIYLPQHGVTKAPVLLFLHGGGFLEGDRAHYGFVAPAYAREGAIVVVASYRLASAGFVFPVAEDDTKRIITWLHANIARFGGNPDGLVVSGHSAGGILAAEVGGDRSWLRAAGLPDGTIKAIVPVSGTYDLKPDDYGGDRVFVTPEAKAAASALQHIDDPAPVAIVALGSTESYIMDTSRAYAAALSAKGVATQTIIVPGADHAGAVRALGDPSSPLFKAVLAELKR